nr:MAG TPA: hypothetical protein [Caudoviricetes sp.]
MADKQYHNKKCPHRATCEGVYGQTKQEMIL